MNNKEHIIYKTKNINSNNIICSKNTEPPPSKIVLDEFDMPCSNYDLIGKIFNKKYVEKITRELQG